MITSPCKGCQGKGTVELQKEITIQVPKGADTGHTIKVEGEGEPGTDGGGAGDLYIRLRVKDHPVFERRGSNIYVTKEITITQALLGGTVYMVPGLDGNLSIQIPEGTEDGAVFKIEGKGMPRFEDERGDEYIIIKVTMPKNLGEEEKILLQQFARLRMLRLDPNFLYQPSLGLPALPPPSGKQEE